MSVKVLSTITRSVSWISVPHWSMQNTAQRCSSARQDKVKTAKSCLKVLFPYFNDMHTLSFHFLIYILSIETFTVVQTVSINTPPRLTSFVFEVLWVLPHQGDPQIYRGQIIKWKTHICCLREVFMNLSLTHTWQSYFSQTWRWCFRGPAGQEIDNLSQQPCTHSAQRSINTTGGGQMNINAIQNKKHCKGI